MSYILDALKKSDQERKRGDVPNLQTVHIPVAIEQRMPWAMYGFMAVLLILLIVLLAKFALDNMSQPGAQQYSESPLKNDESTLELIKSSPLKQQAQEQIKTQRVPIDKLQDKKIAQDLTPPAWVKDIKAGGEVKDPADRPLQNKQMLMRSISAKPKESRAEESGQDENQSQKKQANNAQQKTRQSELSLENIPFYNELPEYLQESIPFMDFAGHVYATKPSNRSIIINGDVMSQGDEIKPGFSIVQITPRGVVFRFNGKLFRRDVLQDWSFDE